MKRTCFGAASVLVLATALLAVAAPSVAQAADPLAKAKALYAEAAYEEALKVLGAGEGPEAHQYRALCFIALGRSADAERAIETLIRSAPTYKFPEAELPPRLVTLVTQTRQRVMPELVRSLFADARDDFQAKELQRARGKFEQVLALLKDPSVSALPDTRDLELLTSGYLDIVKNTPPPAPVPAKTPTATAAVPSAAVSPKPIVSRPVQVTPAVTIEQTVPPFSIAGNPFRSANAVAETRTGAVKIVIGTDGRVKSAEITSPIEPRYDQRLLQAARSWRYRPALRDGKPVESEKIVEVHVELR